MYGFLPSCHLLPSIRVSKNQLSAGAQDAISGSVAQNVTPADEDRWTPEGELFKTGQEGWGGACVV